MTDILQWKEVTEDRYDEMLGVLPPLDWLPHGFLVGEPWDHHPEKGYPRFGAMLKFRGKFYEGMHPIGRRQWRALDFAAIERSLKL